MNTRSSSYTGRAARSMTEAFGPYASGPISEKPEQTPLGHRVLNVCMPIVLLAVVSAIALGY